MTTLRSILCIQVLMYKKLSSFVVSSTFKYTDFLRTEKKKICTFCLPLLYTHILYYWFLCVHLKIERRSCKLKLIHHLQPFLFAKTCFYRTSIVIDSFLINTRVSRRIVITRLVLQNTIIKILMYMQNSYFHEYKYWDKLKNALCHIQATANFLRISEIEWDHYHIYQKRELT